MSSSARTCSRRSPRRAGCWATLKLESRFEPALIEALRNAGHEVEVLEPFTSTMGHAGAVAVSPEGRYEGASDPRSDGDAVAL